MNDRDDPPTFDSDGALLDWLAEALINADDPDAALRLLCASLGRHLDVSRVGYGEVDVDAGTLRIPADWTRGVASFAGQWTLRPDDYHIRFYMRGEALAYRDWRELPISPAERADMGASGSTAVISVPLMRGGRWESLFTVMDHRVREWTATEVALVRRVAAQARSMLAHAYALRSLRASEQQFRSITENVPGICWLADAEGRTVWVNRAGLELLGDTVKMNIDNLPHVVHPDDVETVQAVWAHALATGEPIETVVRTLVHDGSYRPMLGRAQPIRDEGGAIVRWCGVQVDLTEERLRMRGDQLLRDLAEQTRELTDADEIVRLTNAALGQHLRVTRVAFTETDPADRGVYHVAQEWVAGDVPSVVGSFRMAEFYPELVAAYGRGETIVSDDARTDPLLSPASVERLAAQGICSGISVPVVRNGDVVAVLVAQLNMPRSWSTDEIELVKALAERTWATLTRARAERALRERDRHQAFLLAWNDAVRTTGEPAAILEALSDMLRTHLGSSRVLYSEIGDDPFIFRVLRDNGDQTRSAVGDQHLPPGYAPLIAALLRGETVVHDDVAVLDDTLMPGVREHSHAHGVSAGIHVPLVKDGRLVAVLTVHNAVPRRWQRDEVRLVEEVAERAWATLSRARAERALRERDRWQTILLRWNDAVRGETGPRAILKITLATIGRELRVGRVNFAEASPAGDELLVEDDWTAGLASVVGQRFPLAALGARVVEQHLTGRPFCTGDTHDDPRFDPATLAVYDAVGARAFISIPLVRAGALVAVLSVQDKRPRTWGDEEVNLLTELADRTWAIIERARSEERLAESEALLAGYFENAPIAMYLKDAEGRYVRLNQPMAQVLGVPLERAHGRTAPELIEPAVAARVAELDRAALAEGVQASELVFADREELSSLLSIRFPITAPNGTTQLGGFTLDLTDRKKAEAELARSRDALHQSEKLNALGSLLAGVSHELNNPLSIVVAQAVMMERQAAGSELAERAYKIRKAADRCARIVQTFLAMARQKRPERRPVDLNAVAAGAVELADYGLTTDGIVVDCAWAADLPRISADADQLHQVIINLVVNAQHAMADTAVADRRLSLRTAAGALPGTVTLDIVDTGPGIPDDLRRRIFEPFFTTKLQGEGTGVGLSFSQGLAEAHGGRLDLLTSPRGAHFRLTLPISPDVPVPATVDPVAPAASPAERRALIVDDEPEIAESLADFLRLEGFACDIAAGGRAAMGRLADTAYDLVVSDLRMPDVDGPALYAWICEQRPELARRTAFATGDTLGAHVARFIAEAGRPVLEKPFMPDGVRRLLKQMEP